jgi:acyl dehydratase
MELAVGQKAYREMEVTEGMVRAYAEITGDYNPLHFDAEFAARTRFGRLIAQGGITTGLLNALVAMDMPGAGSVFVDQKWSFPRPVYIGDTVRAQATVVSVDEDRPVAAIAFVVKNQREEEVLHGEATVYQSAPVGTGSE